MVIEFNSLDNDVYGKICLSRTVLTDYESIEGVYQLNCSRIHTLSGVYPLAPVEIVNPEETECDRFKFKNGNIRLRRASENNDFTTIFPVRIDPDVRVSRAEGPIRQVTRYINDHFQEEERTSAGFAQPRELFWLGGLGDTDQIVYKYEDAVIDRPILMQLRSVFSISHLTELPSFLSGPVEFALEDDGPIEISYPIADGHGRVTLRVRPTTVKRNGRTIEPLLQDRTTSDNQLIEQAAGSTGVPAISTD